MAPERFAASSHNNHESRLVASYFAFMVITALCVIVSEQSWIRATAIIACFINAWAFMSGLIGILQALQRGNQG